MHCLACDALLRDYELDNRGPVSGELTNLCDFCQAMALGDPDVRQADGSPAPEIQIDRDLEYDEPSEVIY